MALTLTLSLGERGLEQVPAFAGTTTAPYRLRGACE